MVDGDLVVNPTHEQIENGQLELVVSSGSEGVMMIEAGGQQIEEETMAQAIELAHRVNQSLIALQNELREKVGKAKTEMLKRTVPDKRYRSGSGALRRCLERSDSHADERRAQCGA